MTPNHTVAIDLGNSGEVVGSEVLGLGAEELARDVLRDWLKYR